MQKQDNHKEGKELTPDEPMIAAKNKFDTMVEKGTWNAPTAEEKIVALKAKFNSTMKSLNKKVTFKRSKKKVVEMKADKPSSKKKEGNHPKKWKAPKQGDKKEVKFKGHTWYWCAARTPVENARSGEPKSQKSARGWQRAQLVTNEREN
jgi:hypothetical protein